MSHPNLTFYGGELALLLFLLLALPPSEMVAPVIFGFGAHLFGSLVTVPMLWYSTTFENINNLRKARGASAFAAALIAMCCVAAVHLRHEASVTATTHLLLACIHASVFCTSRIHAHQNKDQR
ncbi:hypothetical protein [Luteibacter sp. E-22]|uniref:hypothetical protein n=1 Tax=Luteibacter sp. E-22 TaxID=3404050 RepID=UPI003CE76183